MCPLVFEPNDEIYAKRGLSFASFPHLESLGLVTFGQVGGVSRQGLPRKFAITYGNTLVQVELAEGTDKLQIGRVLLTDAGQRLAGLTNAQALPEFPEYVFGKWAGHGHKAVIAGVVSRNPLDEKAA